MQKGARANKSEYEGVCSIGASIGSACVPERLYAFFLGYFLKIEAVLEPYHCERVYSSGLSANREEGTLPRAGQCRNALDAFMV